MLPVSPASAAKPDVARRQRPIEHQRRDQQQHQQPRPLRGQHRGHGRGAPRRDAAEEIGGAVERCRPEREERRGHRSPRPGRTGDVRSPRSGSARARRRSAHRRRRRAPRAAAASSRSSRNSASVDESVSRVRVPWRQFQRRQVTPRSSAQTTSPGAGCSTSGAPLATVSKVSSPAARNQPDRPGEAGEVLAAHRQHVADADRVVDVHQPVDARQSAGAGPLPQRVHRGRGALRLGAERAVGLPPGGDVRR